MIAIRTKNLSPLFSDLLGFQKFIKSLPGVKLVISPGDGVDWELSGAIPEETEVYSLIPHTKEAQGTIESHKLALAISGLTPLFPASSNLDDLKEFPRCGLYDVHNLEEIMEFEEITGEVPEIIRLSINPLKYPKDILDYCKAKKIKILGTDIFGPHHLRDYFLEMFSESFLQAFGEHNTDIMEIPGEDPYFIKRVYQRLGEGQDNLKLLEYSKPIDKVPPFKIPSKKIYQETVIEVPDKGKITISGVKGSFSLKPIEEKLDLGEPLWEDLILPEDIDTSSSDKELLGTLHRYHVLPELQELHSPKVWKPVFTKIQPDFWAIKFIPKKWFGWMWKEHLYWLISGKLWKMPLDSHKNLNNDKH